MPRHFAHVETYAFTEKRVFADCGQITVDAFLEHTLGTRRLGPIGSVVRVVEIGETVVRIMPVSNEEVVVQVKRNVSLATAFGAQGGDEQKLLRGRLDGSACEDTTGAEELENLDLHGSWGAVEVPSHNDIGDGGAADALAGRAGCRDGGQGGDARARKVGIITGS